MFPDCRSGYPEFITDSLPGKGTLCTFKDLKYFKCGFRHLITFAN